MKKIRIALVVVLVFLMHSAAFAANTSWYTIFELKVIADDAQVILNGNVTCGSASTATFTFYEQDEGYEHMLRLATSAFLAGRQVSIQYTCNGTSANLTGVRMR